MTLLEAVLLALALCADSLVLSTTCAFKSKMSYRKGVLMAATFGVFQGAFPLIGALLGGAFRQVIASIDHWIAFGLLALVGGKMIWDAFHPDDIEGQLDVTKFKTMCILGVAESIDALVVGITFGLSNTIFETLYTCGIIAIVTFIVAMAGIFLGKRDVPIPEKAATILAGIVLIGLGAYTLAEHLLGF